MEFARSFTLLQYGIQSKKCTDQQCVKEMASVNFFYALTLYDAFYKNGGNAADALNKGKPVVAAYEDKANQSANRALARAAQAAAAVKSFSQTNSGKLAILAPKVRLATQVGLNLHVRNKADYTRLIQTHAKPNMNHGRPYQRPNQ